MAGGAGQGRAAGLALLLGALATPAPCAARIDWGSDPIAAYRVAEEERRPILLLLTGGPCGGRAPIGDPTSGDFRTRCELLEADVLSHPDVVAAAARYVPVLLDEARPPLAGRDPAESDLARRYKLHTVPTLLIADPWGNEIVRMVGYTQRDRVLRILSAVPEDFAPLRSAGEALRAEPAAPPALLAAAGFYESNGLRPIADLYYERAANALGPTTPVAARRRVAIARGLNLLKMRQAKRAAELLEREASLGSTGELGDALLFAWAMAALDVGDAGKARKLSERLGREFPSSAYTANLHQRLEAR